MTPEARVKTDIKKLLLGMGFWNAGGKPPALSVIGWFYMPVSNGMGVHGIPDFVGCWLGRFFSIEAKAPGGVVSPNQLKRHEEIREAGGIVLTISDVSELAEFFNTTQPPNYVS